MSSNSGESVMDVLARMKSELAFDVDELALSGEVTPKSATTTAASLVPAATAVAAGPALKSASPSLASAAAQPTGATEEPDAAEDLSSYMGNLLNRYGQGGSAGDGTVAAEATERANGGTSSALPRRKPRASALADAAAVPGESEETAEVASANEDADPLPPELCLLGQQAFKPRKRAPEEKACIDAMRELAVHSARRALQTFDNKRRGLDAKHRLGLAFAAYATSGVAFAFSEDTFSLLGMVAICGVATGSMFVINWQQTVALLKKSSGNG